MKTPSTSRIAFISLVLLASNLCLLPEIYAATSKTKPALRAIDASAAKVDQPETKSAAKEETKAPQPPAVNQSQPTANTNGNYSYRPYGTSNGLPPGYPGAAYPSGYTAAPNSYGVAPGTYPAAPYQQPTGMLAQGNYGSSPMQQLPPYGAPPGGYGGQPQYSVPPNQQQANYGGSAPAQPWQPGYGQPAATNPTPYGGYQPQQQPQQYAPPSGQMNVNPALQQMVPEFGKPLPQVPPSMVAPMAPGVGLGPGYSPAPGGTPQAPPMSVEEQRCARLEQTAFGSTYPEHEVVDRLEHLEREVFNKVLGGPDTNARLARLEQKLGGQGAFGNGHPPNPMPPAAQPAQTGGNQLVNLQPVQTGYQPQQMSGQQPMGGQPPQMSAQPPMMGGQPPQMGGQPPMMGGQPMFGGQPPQIGSQQPLMAAQPRYPNAQYQPQAAPPYGAPVQQNQGMPPQGQPQPNQPANANTQPNRGSNNARPASSNTKGKGTQTTKQAPAARPVANSDGLSDDSGRAASEFQTAVQSIPFDPKAAEYLSSIQKFPGSTYAHWTSFPIRVHLPMNSPDNWKQALESSMHRWDQVLPLMSAAAQEPADIEIAWINHLQPKQLGITNLEIFNGRMRVTVYLLRPNYYPPDVPEKALQQVATHEIGHALGLFGHSPEAGDAMQSLESHMGKGKWTGSTNLSPRDINTLRRLYESPGLPPGFQRPQPISWP